MAAGNRGCFVMLNGPVACGKTTLAKYLLSNYVPLYRKVQSQDRHDYHTNFCVVHVNFDEMVDCAMKSYRKYKPTEIENTLKRMYPAQQLSYQSIEATMLVLNRINRNTALPLQEVETDIMTGNGETEILNWDSRVWKHVRQTAFAYCQNLVRRGSNSRSSNSSIASTNNNNNIQPLAGDHLLRRGGISEAYFMIEPSEKDSYNSVQKFFVLIIMDDNFLLRSMRKRYFQLARSNEFGFVQVSLQVPLRVSQARNKNRRLSKRIPLDVVRHSHQHNEVRNR